MGIKDNCLYSRSIENEDGADDVWDDALLIRAYENAVKIAKEKIQSKKEEHENVDQKNLKSLVKENKKGKNNLKDNSSVNWKCGDHCRATYSVDGKEYEATITHLMPWKRRCIVRYIGYDNEEEIDTSTLKPTKGEKIRCLQIGESRKHQEETEEPVNNEETRLSGSHIFTMIPPPPPINMMSHLTSDEGEAFSSMLMSWYMNGYHTGYYQGLMRHKQEIKNQNRGDLMEEATTSS